MLPVTNRSKPKIKTIKVGSRSHSYKTYSWGVHEAIFGPLKGTTFNSKAELKAAMEAHPTYNNKLNEAKDSMIETKPAGGGKHDVYWNGKKTHHQLIHVSGGGSRGAARAGVGGYKYFIHNTKTGKSVNFPFSLPDAKRELRRRYNTNDPHSMNEDTGLPKKYVTGLSASTAKARKAHWDKANKLSDRDPRAYKPAPGDATAKTKPSKATREIRKIMSNEEVELTEVAENSLSAKAKKFGVSLTTLKTVYRRGVAAWNSGHRPGTTPQQWGHARVNAYLRKGKGTYHGADKDLREDAPANAVGGGNVAGLGVGPQGEPPGKIAAMKKTPINRFKDFLKKTMK